MSVMHSSRVAPISTDEISSVGWQNREVAVIQGGITVYSETAELSHCIEWLKAAFCKVVRNEGKVTLKDFKQVAKDIVSLKPLII